MKNKKSRNTQGMRQWKKFKRNKMAVIALIVLGILIFASAFAPLLTSYDPEAISLTERTLAPSKTHLLGTDKVGRDVFTRLLYGGRISILIGLTGALGGAIIGAALGCLGGYFGGLLDRFLLRLSELFTTFPQTILVLILVEFMGQGVWNLFIVFWCTGWMGTYRMTRAKILSLREETYVLAYQAFGISNRSIMFRHILPNAAGPVIVNITLSTAGYVLQESALSFLGLGVPSSTPTWGNIFNAAKALDVVQAYPWLWLSPGIAISLFVLSVNIIGDGLRDALDPNQ